jgi:hypothetical protein
MIKYSNFIILASLLYIIVAIFSINKPLTLDQANPVAENAGAIAHFGFDALGSKNIHYEIAHPTLHQHLLATVFRIFGETTFSARLLGVICFIGVLSLIMLLSIQIYQGNKGIIIGGIASIIYSINPFIIQNSLVVDQETTILPITLLIFFYIIFRKNFIFNSIAIIELSASLALCIWAKDITPYFMIIALFPFLWLYRGFRNAITVTLQITFIGTAIFFVTWILYCFVTKIPVFSFIEFSILNKAVNPDFHIGRSITQGIWKLINFTGRWVTPALLILLALAASSRILQLKRERFTLKQNDYLWFYVGLYWIITNLYMYNIPRYQYPLYSIAVILIGEHLYTSLCEIKRRNIIISILFGLIIAGIMALVFEDPVLQKADIGYKKYVLFMVILPMLIILILNKYNGILFLSYENIIMVFSCLLIASNVSLNIKQTRPYTTAVSWNEYGEEGFMDTLEYLKINLGASIPVIRKDFAYYLSIDQPNREYMYVYTNIFRRDNLKNVNSIYNIQSKLLTEKIKYIVLDQHANPATAKNIISPYFDYVQRFGDFTVYRKKYHQLPDVKE